MSQSPQYRSALVTGASRGVGAEIVRSLVAEGLEVWALARPSEALDALVEETGCHAVPADLNNDSETDAALAGLDIDVLVNNAGVISAVKPFAELSGDEADAMLSLNLRAPLRVTRALLPEMIARSRGHIFAITSIFGPYSGPNMAVYCATKAAIRSFCGCLRMDLAGTGIRVTEIAPGRTETGIYLDAFAGNQDALDGKLFNKYRTLQPEDVAQALIGALRLPARADANIIELSPTDQAAGGMVFAERQV